VPNPSTCAKPLQCFRHQVWTQRILGGIGKDRCPNPHRFYTTAGYSAKEYAVFADLGCREGPSRTFHKIIGALGMPVIRNVVASLFFEESCNDACDLQSRGPHRELAASCSAAEVQSSAYHGCLPPQRAGDPGCASESAEEYALSSCPDCAVKRGKRNAKEKNGQNPQIGHPGNYSWSELMKRVFGFDVLRCDCCGGRMNKALSIPQYIGCATFGNQPKICAKRMSLFYDVIEGVPWHQFLTDFSLIVDCRFFPESAVWHCDPGART